MVMLPVGPTFLLYSPPASIHPQDCLMVIGWLLELRRIKGHLLAEQVFSKELNLEVPLSDFCLHLISNPVTRGLKMVFYLRLLQQCRGSFSKEGADNRYGLALTISVVV